MRESVFDYGLYTRKRKFTNTPAQIVRKNLLPIRIFDGFRVARSTGQFRNTRITLATDIVHISVSMQRLNGEDRVSNNAHTYITWRYGPEKKGTLYITFWTICYLIQREFTTQGR